QVASTVGNFFDELIGDVTDSNECGDGHAALPSGPKAGVDGVIGYRVEVGIGQHEHVVFGTAQCLDAFAVRGGSFINIFRDRGGPHKGHRFDVVVFEQRINSWFTAV